MTTTLWVFLSCSQSMRTCEIVQHYTAVLGLAGLVISLAGMHFLGFGFFSELEW